MRVVYLQGRTHKAGAQTALERLMRTENMAPFKPILVCGHPGWLTEQCTKHGIPWFATCFPKSRSLQARLYGNRRFAKRVSAMLIQKGIHPVLICANDYIENLLAVELSRHLHVPQTVFVRSSGISKSGYKKYACEKTDAVIGITEDMRKHIQRWAEESTVHLVHDALYEDEILPPTSLLSTPPSTLLVIGSPAPGKGWTDFTQALLIGSLDDGTFKKIYFTGIPFDTKSLGLDRFNNMEFEFLEWTHNFPALVRKFSLVINPSRAEAFGLALTEAIATGVPVLSTRTGIAEQVIADDRFLCEPRNPESMASALRLLPDAWHAVPQLIQDGQNTIRTRFTMQHSSEKARGIFWNLVQSNEIFDLCTK